MSVAALALMGAASVGAYAHAQAQADAKAAAVMADVRKALGGEQKLAAMKGLSLRADYRREMSAGPGGGGGMTFVMMGGGGTTSGSQQTTGKIEIDLDLPDKYLRIDVGSAAFGYDTYRWLRSVTSVSRGGSRTPRACASRSTTRRPTPREPRRRSNGVRRISRASISG